MKYLLLFTGFLLLVAAATLSFAGRGKDDLARAEFSVRKLTCVACARNIDKALAGLPGIESTEVDVAAGRATVTFAPGETSAGIIAETISAAGYPAGLLRVVTADAANPAEKVVAPGVKQATGKGCACCN